MWWDVVLPVVGTLLGAGARHWLGERTWARVRSVARAMAPDPTKTSDPKQAVKDALIQVMLDRLASEAKRVEAAFVVNGKSHLK